MQMPRPDYYAVLGLDDSADTEVIERVYRILAARYHPDNQQSGDAERFHLVREAAETLRYPEQREAYDSARAQQRQQPLGVFLSKEFSDDVAGEQNRRLGILCLLYNRRRTEPTRPGMHVTQLEQLMLIPREHLEFTVWYLRKKGLAEQDDRSALAITADGADLLEAAIPGNSALSDLLRFRSSSTSSEPGRRNGNGRSAA